MQLTDQQLLEAYCAYLLYGVEGVDRRNQNLHFKLIGLEPNLFSGKTQAVWEYTGEDSSVSNRSDCLLLLTPMSELIKHENYTRLITDLLTEQNSDLIINSITIIERLSSESFLTVNYQYSETYDNHNKTLRLNLKDVSNQPFYLVQYLIKHHFDVFGLIPLGYAVDKTKIK